MKSMTIQSKLTMTWLLSYISIASVSAAMITPALPHIEQTFALNTGMVEWIVSIFLIGYVIGQLIYAPLANVYGRLNALKWGLNINILGLLLCLYASISPHYLLLLLGRLITGLGSAAGLTCTFIKCAVKPLPSGGGYKALVQNNMLLYTSFIQMDKPWGSRG